MLKTGAECPHEITYAGDIEQDESFDTLNSITVGNAKLNASISGNARN